MARMHLFANEVPNNRYDNLCGSRPRKRSMNDLPMPNYCVPPNYCPTCNYFCTSDEFHNDHFSSIKHLKILGNRAHAELRERKHRGERVRLVPTGKASLGQADIENSEELVIGGSYVHEIVHPVIRDKVMFRCQLCNRSLDSNKSLVTHMIGNRHRRQYFKQRFPDIEERCKELWDDRLGMGEWMEECTSKVHNAEGCGVIMQMVEIVDHGAPTPPPDEQIADVKGPEALLDRHEALDFRQSYLAASDIDLAHPSTILSADATSSSTSVESNMFVCPRVYPLTRAADYYPLIHKVMTHSCSADEARQAQLLVRQILARIGAGAGRQKR